MEAVDCLIDARWVIPVEPPGAVLALHSVAVRAGRIVAVLPTAEASGRFQPAARFELAGHALMPGLVNLHTHASMALMRGLADDVPLSRWLTEHVLPAEAKHVSSEFVHDGSLLACAEMLRGGVTCFNEMYFHPEAAARAALASGMRAAIGILVMDAPTPYASDCDDYIAKGLAMRDEFKSNALLSFCMAPQAPHAVGDRTLSRLLTVAEELDLPIHTHLHETREEIERSVSQHGVRPLERLHALGIVGPRLIAAHAVHVNDSELQMLARYGCSVAHCPSSNLKLASGFAPVAAMLERGVNVGFGTDGAASNNRLDVLGEMRLAALLAKATSGNAESMPAHQALRAATLGGARALGLEGVTGSIETGKSADFCALEFASPELAPCYDPVSHIVYSAGRENVSHVWVAGELLVEKRRLIYLKAPALDKRALLWQNYLAAETKA